MKAKFLSFMLCLLLAAPCLFADENEVEIQLFEVGQSGFVNGDEPFGDTGQNGHIPPRPADFHTTLNGHLLSVTVDNDYQTLVVVHNSSGNMVLDREFYNFTSEELQNTGYHTIVIVCQGVTLSGHFIVH